MSTAKPRPFRVGDRVRFRFEDWGSPTGARRGAGTVSEVHPSTVQGGVTRCPWLRVTRDEARPTHDSDFPEPITSETFDLTDDMAAPREAGAALTIVDSVRRH